LIEAFDPFAVALNQKLGGEDLRRQLLALEGSLEVGRKGAERHVGRQDGDVDVADDRLLPIEFGEGGQLVIDFAGRRNRG
jgi:hypothetical protein